jgi:PAS domain S-box-containing protein
LTVDFEALFDAAPNSYVLLDRSLRVVWANRAYLAVTSRKLEDIVGRTMFEAFPSGESEAGLRSSLERVLRDGRPDSIALIRYAIPRSGPNGSWLEERFWSATHTPIPDGGRQVEYILQHTVDVTELHRLRQTATDAQTSDVLRRAQDVQQKSDAIDLERRRLRELFHQAPGFVAFLSGPEHVFELANEAYYALVGDRDLIGRPVRVAFPEVDGQGFLALLDQVYGTGMPFIGRDMKLTLGDGPAAEARDVYLDFIYQPITDRGGRVSGIFVLGNDVTARHQAEERKRLLMREVDHRAKNALAVVQSLVRLTRSDTVEDFINAVDGRVAALARAHSVLARNHWAGATLHDIFQLELAPYTAGRARAPQLAGPSATLVADAVQPLAMVIHELATNAAKYGALAAHEGTLSITWRQNGEGGLAILWEEFGGPPAVPPARLGFGSEMIRAATGQLGGTASFDWRTEGLKVALQIGPGRLAGAPADPEPLLRNAPAPPPKNVSLAGRRILLVEDDAIQALAMKQMLERHGCTIVGPATSVGQALEMAAGERRLTAAILDVDLRGRPSTAVADYLAYRGVPYLFATGHADALGDSRRVPVVHKPLAQDQLVDALVDLLGGGAPMA